MEIVMKKYTKFLALMGAVLAMGACQDDEIISPVKHALPGDEIVFGATGIFESGDKDANPSLVPGVRTVYDKVWTDANGNKFIQVKWVPGVDRMDILCPQSATAGNVKNAQYQVATTNSGDKNDSIASTLQRMGDAGLQWSSANEHHFYAAYPSKEMVGERLQTVIPNEISELGLSTTAEGRNILRGYLPVNQTPKVLPNTTTTRDNGKKVGYVIEPDMTFAYMVADTTINTTNNAPASVGLQFESQVTALEFEIVASEIVQSGGENTENSFNPEIKILGVTLSHANGEDGEVTQIAGHFEYDFDSDEFANIDVAGADAHTYVTQTFPEGYTIDADTGFVDVTFFLFPGVTFNEGGDNKRMKLTVLYQVAGVPQNKTATLIKEIQPKKKYFFSNVKLPAIHEESVSASNWFNALNNKILFNQVSIPVASNVFANDKYDTDINVHRKQQTSKLQDLWNMGVRGFELCNKSTANEDEFTATVQKESLNDMKMIAAESEVDFTFKNALDTLYKCFYGTEEPLILICTYASTNDGYNPYHYVCNLFNSLELFCQEKGLKETDFVQLCDTSTAGNLKGKIAVIIRPGDDERWLYETKVRKSSSWGADPTTTDPYAMLNIGKYDTLRTTTENSPYGLTAYMQFAKQYSERETAQGVLYNNKWWNRVLMVSDWGISSWDSWHRRGGTYYNYATTATNFDAIGSAGRTPVSKSKYEQGIITNSPATLTGNYYYAHDMSNGSIAYIQDMTRVIPTAIENKALTLKYREGTIIIRDKTKDVNVSWNESLNEKKKAIDGLFELAVATKGDLTSDDVHINVLSSYYPTDDWTFDDGNEGGLVSYFPCYDSEKYKRAGLGGDYQSAAEEMTTHTYNLLSGASTITGTEKKLAEGPWGLVMMDYIGDDAVNPDSRKLVNLIMLNNFKFALAKTQGTGTGEGDQGKTE